MNDEPAAGIELAEDLPEPAHGGPVAAPRLRPPAFGEPAPWFRAQSLSGIADYVFDTAAGRPILLLFFGTAADPACAAALSRVAEHRHLFDDKAGCFFGVTIDPSDAGAGRIARQLPGIRFFLDYDRAVSRLYGACQGDGYAPFWLVLDAQLRVAGRFALASAEAAIACYASLAGEGLEDMIAPVLLVPRILEPALCHHLIAEFQAKGGRETGFMRHAEEGMVEVHDALVKRRTDMVVHNPGLRRSIVARIHDKLVPMVERAFQYRPTRLERYLVACYDASSGGYFRRHRDNTGRNTAHRRFAVTINLNAGEYDGGELTFPEFGPRPYSPPAGGAIVFSCSLLHEARPVTRGRRFAFLTFLYDEARLALRERNAAIDEE